MATLQPTEPVPTMPIRTTRGIRAVYMPRSTRLPFDVRQLLRNFPVAHGEEVDAAQVPRPTVALLAVDPLHSRAIAADEHALRLEGRPGVAGEPFAPERHDGGSSDDTLAIGWRRRILENSVVGERRGQRIRVLSIDSRAEFFDRCERSRVLFRAHGCVSHRLLWWSSVSTDMTKIADRNEERGRAEDVWTTRGRKR